MIGRLIDADKLKRHYAWWAGGERELTMDEAKNDFDTIIDLQPTAEPIKHGRWIKKWSALWNEEMPVCSECGKVSVFTSDFCPNCGARMDGGEND